MSDCLHKYDFRWHTELTPLELELLCFREGWPEEKGGAGKFGHARHIISMLWPDPAEQPDTPKSPKPFIWNPWAERILKILCEWQYPAIIGCASSNKTEACAAWAIINWLCDPVNTLVLVTSTSIKDSRRRVWGAITERLSCLQGLPFKMVDSEAKICTVGDDGRYSDRSGIAILSGERKKEKEAVGRLIGLKNKRLFLIADELPELSPAIIEAALGNLSSNQGFQLVGVGNFASIYDPLGQFCAPVEGWESVSVDDEEWATKLGWCIRLDGLKSPNFRSGETKWPFIYNQKTLDGHKKAYGGENSANFWRFCRSFPAPTGVENSIYSESDIRMGKAQEKPIWIKAPIDIAGLDPSYTTGGDRTMAVHARFGLAKTPAGSGQYVICFEECVRLVEDVMDKETPRSHQIARQYIKRCKQWGVSPRRAGIDVTGAGTVLADILDNEWSGYVHRTQFGGQASSLNVLNETNDNENKARTARDKYHNRVTELWFVGREYLVNGQLKGITDDMAREMKSRQYDTVGRRMRAETKADMKSRLGYSPDIWDACVVAIDVARNVLGFSPMGVDQKPKTTEGSWTRQVDTASMVYENADYSAEADYDSIRA